MSIKIKHSEEERERIARESCEKTLLSHLLFLVRFITFMLILMGVSMLLAIILVNII